MFVNFAAPEQHLATIRRLSIGPETAGERDRQRQSRDASRRASLSLIDNAVDSNTGTIRLKGTFDNKDGMLWPGQFVTVVLTLDTRTSTVVPAEAVQNGQQGQFVYVVKAGQSRGDPAGNRGAAVRQKMVIDKGVARGRGGGHGRAVAPVPGRADQGC